MYSNNQSFLIKFLFGTCFNGAKERKSKKDRGGRKEGYGGTSGTGRREREREKRRTQAWNSISKRQPSVFLFVLIWKLICREMERPVFQRTFYCIASCNWDVRRFFDYNRATVAPPPPPPPLHPPFFLGLNPQIPLARMSLRRQVKRVFTNSESDTIK